MFFHQIIRSDIGCASYLIGDERAGVAAVVDPRWDAVEEYLTLAREHGLRIVQILETHVHADHLSGCRRLAALTGATIAISGAAHVGYPATPLAHGVTLALGGVSIRALATPGHSPDSMTFVVTDPDTSAEHLLTGDCLFVGDVGRPDLHGADGSTALYDSLQYLLQWPDSTPVLPGHVAGSLCGRSMSTDPRSTVARERQSNATLAVGSREEFVAALNEDLPARPPNFHYLIALNRAGPPTDLPAPAPVGAAELRPLLASGAIVLDTRDPASFAEGYIAGSIHVALDGGQFNGRAAWLLPAATLIVLVVERPEDAQAAANALAVVGHLGPVRYLLADPTDWAQSALRIVRLAQLTPEELAGRLAAPDRPLVLDVREPGEYEAGHIPGAINIPFRLLERRIYELPDDADRIVTVCAGGIRSSIAASILQRMGQRRVWNLVGGTDAWREAALPVEK